MKTFSYNAFLCLGLGFAFAASPVFAQDAMQSMDMSHMHHQTRKPAKSDTENKPQPSKNTQEPVQNPATHSMRGMDMSSMPNMTMPPALQHAHPQDAMHGMHMQGGKVPPDARSADYSDGIGYGPMPGMDMLDDAALGMLLIDRLEYFNGHDDNGVAVDAQGWYGTDANKLWFKAEGEHSAGRLQDLRTEALWSHPVSIYWNTQLGVRHDFGVGPGRTWAAFGVQGLAPYWFDVEATVYIGQAGRTAFRFESEYEMPITQRLILQPRFEVNFYGRDDPQFGVGSGLSDAKLGLRLRYEFIRKFAPYIGVEWERKFGKTADLARHADEPTFDPRLVAGLRFWF